MRDYRRPLLCGLSALALAGVVACSDKTADAVNNAGQSMGNDIGNATNRYRAVHADTVEDVVALDIALPRNALDWFEILPPELAAQVEQPMYCGHFFCHVMHQKYLVKKGVDCAQFKERVLSPPVLALAARSGPACLAAPLAACDPAPPTAAFAAWRGPPAGLDDPALFALSWAVLAPSPLNTQPWLVERPAAERLMLRLDPARGKVYVTVTTDMLGGSYVYTLPLVAAPKAADLKVFKKFALGEAADGIAFGAAGDLYVTLALPTTSGFVVLGPDGVEKQRAVNALLSPTVPYDSPANLAFDGIDSLFVVNHAFATNLPSHYTVLDVYVGETGSPLELPTIP